MANSEWFSVASAAETLNLSSAAIYKRVERHGDSPLIDRLDAGPDGGPRRVLLHQELVERWASDRVERDRDAESVEVLQQSLRHTEIVAQDAELRARDREIELLREALANRDAELAAMREAFHVLTRPRTV